MDSSTLQVVEVTKRFGSGATEVTAVRHISMTVDPGEVVLIMGPSGSGKTTLLMLLGALLKPSEGTIRLNGDVISALNEGRLPGVRLRQFGFIFQDFNLLSALSALENVAIVGSLNGLNSRQARRKAETLLSELGLSERLTFLPEKLSGGEKQRVAVARALMNAGVILADEPTAIDSRSARVMRCACDRQANRSVVIISHDQRIKDADRVLWLVNRQFKGDRRFGRRPVADVHRRAAARLTWEGWYVARLPEFKPGGNRRLPA
jgi:putative ABC transport system ATP-binding protein